MPPLPERLARKYQPEMAREIVQVNAPFPYFGGKSRVADRVWRGIGNVPHYVEPFCGSAAVLLLRPHRQRVETINDRDCMVANFWRAAQHAPEELAEWCNWPVNEADLHARHHWLVYGEGATEFRQRMMKDPDYYDVKRAGWWCWGLCAWLGDKWCPDHGKNLPKTRPHLGNQGTGIHSSCGTLSDEHRTKRLLTQFRALKTRMRNVRVCCGDWKRVVGPSVESSGTPVGIFFDPPYSYASGRTKDIYVQDSSSVAHEVRTYCKEHGQNPNFRIVLAGYEGEHEELEEQGWTVESWKAQGGYAGLGNGIGKKNRHR